MVAMIEAVFVGGIIQSMAAQGLTFRHPMTAASATFGGSRLLSDAEGRISSEISQTWTDTSRVTPEKAVHRLHKALMIERRFQSALETGLPVRSNIWMAARNSVMVALTAARANGKDATTMSGKLLLMAAAEYFEQYAAPYRTMVSRAPKVVAVFGPFRRDDPACQDGL